MSNGSDIKPTDLRGILKYVPRFQGQTFVIALDGIIVADENFANILIDLAVLRSLGIKIILVHGIGHQIDELSRTRKIPITDVQGTGVADAATLDLAIRASSRVTHLVIEGLTQNGLKAALTNAIRAVPLGIIRGVDHQFTGRVDRVDKEFLTQLIESQVVPVVNPIGFDRDGRPLRINSDLMAAELAEALNATKIIYLTPHEGLEVNGKLQHQISAATLRGILDSKPESISEPMRSTAAHAVKAVETGTPRIHLLDGRLMDGNEYQQIRQATKRDVRAIHNLTRQAVKREELLHRTQAAIEKNIEQFYVFEIDENIIACVSLNLYPDKAKFAEVGSLYVMPFYHHRGIGKKMVDYACMMAKERGVTTVIALSTQAISFFTSVVGFEEAEKDVLPESRLKAYDDSGRNSRVMIKKL